MQTIQLDNGRFVEVEYDYGDLYSFCGAVVLGEFGADIYTEDDEDSPFNKFINKQLTIPERELVYQEVLSELEKDWEYKPNHQELDHLLFISDRQRYPYQGAAPQKAELSLWDMGKLMNFASLPEFKNINSGNVVRVFYKFRSEI